MKKRFYAAALGTGLLALALAANSLPDGSAAGGYRLDTPYAYPITLDMPEWKTLGSLDEKQKACQIPEEVLAELTTPALIETVLAYLLGVNVYAYGPVSEGIGVVAEDFNGLAELQRRQAEDPDGTREALSRRLSQVGGGDAEDFETVYARDLLTGLLDGAEAASAG